MQVIMVAGRAGEGKTTFSDICIGILAKHDIMADKVPFAQGVKDTARSMGWDGVKDNKGRRLLQQVGNTGREYNTDIWAQQAVDIIEAEEAVNAYDVIFIDDWRFMNEGTKVVLNAYPTTLKLRVIRPKEFHTLYGSVLYNDTSETGLPEADSVEGFNFYDRLIYNTNGLEGLREEAVDFINEVLLPKLDRHNA
ncbi:hypothetical protein LCGC14_0593080 [marine sediment metagenome]|uniref:NadR/Ttd14 AAA domain-containing protein n=1 Tax=marine sediment metagenome TaxID=412755 RepID=A0A0F9RCS8_9ZZZZ